MAAVHEQVDAQTPRRRGRRGINILVLANPDHSSSEEDTPANSATFYSSSASAYGTAPSRPPTIRAPSPPRRPSSPRRSQLAAAQTQTASPRTLASPSPTSYVSASGSSARSSNSPGPESTPPPPTPNQGLPPLDINFQAATKPNHVTPNLPFEDSDNQPESSSVPAPVFPQHARRTSDGGRAIQVGARLLLSSTAHRFLVSEHTQAVFSPRPQCHFAAQRHPRAHHCRRHT